MLFKNTAAQSAPMITAYLLSFVLAPIMLDRLGLAAFGVWAVTGAIAQYAGLLDLGVSRALARFVARYDAEGDRRGIAESTGLGLAVIGAVGVVSVVGAIFAAPLVSDAVGVLDTAEMRVVLLSSVTILFFNLLKAVFESVPVGLRRMVPPNVMAVIGNFVNFGASIAALATSTELTTYAVANAAATAVAALLALAAFVYVASAPYVRFPNPQRAREIFSFAIKTQVGWITALLNKQTDKIIIASMVGARAAGAYELANRVVLAVQSVGLLSLSAMIPTATAEIVERGRDMVGGFYRRYTTRSLAVALPLAATACVSAPYLLMAWLDTSPADSVTVIVLLTAAFFVNMATGVATSLLAADGRPGVTAQAAIVTAVLNVGLTLALAAPFGLWGVLLGTVAAETIGSILLLVRFHRIYGLPATDLLRSAGPPAALSLVLCVPFVAWYAITGTDVDDRALAAAGLVGTSGIYLVTFWLAASRLSLLPDRLDAGRLLRKLRPRARAAS